MSAIKAGDLVVIVGPSLCCRSVVSIGKIFKVIPDRDRLPHTRCRGCGFTFSRTPDYDVLLSNGTYCARVRLKRIDPLSEPESTEHKETLTA